MVPVVIRGLGAVTLKLGECFQQIPGTTPKQAAKMLHRTLKLRGLR